jgi:hypothetical protein
MSSEEIDWPLPTEAQTGPSNEADSQECLFFAGAAHPSEPLEIDDRDENGPAEARGPRRRRILGKASILAAAAGTAAVLAGYLWLQPLSGRTAASGKSVTLKVPAIVLPPPNLLRPISPEEALKENEARPFVVRPDSPASRFVLHTDAPDKERALTCLAQAVYYEAAGEGADGERAVAQVVLNRMRHPGYPASVCGVVYQGSERGTGCQFTFACDGSLLRAPAASLWARARKIAEEALAGKVFAPVGHATHYHADYVLPYWADSLDKTVQIGRHIFYRLPSVLGDSRSFFQHYAGKEPEIPKPDAATILPDAPTDPLASALISDASKTTAEQIEKAASPASPLAIDSTRGTLLADAQVPTIEARQPKASNECAVSSKGKQLTPLGANDLRAGVSTPGC